MTRVFRLLSVAMLVAIVPTFAIASITPADLVPGVFNHLEDDDFEGGILGGDDTLDVGDVLFGMFRVQALRVPPFGTSVPGTNDTTTTFAGVFAIQVATKTPAAAPGPFTWTFDPVSDAIWDGIFTNYPDLDPGGGGLRYSSDTMFSVFQDTDSPDYITDGVPTSGSNGTFLWEFGSDPTLGHIWEATAPSDDPLDLTETTIGGAPGPGDFGLGLYLLYSESGPAFELHDFFGFGTDFHLEGFGSFWNNTSSSDTSTTPIASDGDFIVRPVIPEPASLVVWLGLSITLIGSSRRRS